MKLNTRISRLLLASALVGSLGACTVTPAYPVAYRSSSVYVETYPTYYRGPAVYSGYAYGGYRPLPPPPPRPPGFGGWPHHHPHGWGWR